MSNDLDKNYKVVITGFGPFQGVMFLFLVC